MNQIKLLLLIFCCFMVVSACYYDNEEELYGNVECDVSNVTYTNNVLPVLQQNCYTCHSAQANQGGVTLEGYSALKVYVNNGRFIGAINHLGGFSPMPQNAPKLLDCTLEQIQVWVDNGAPNN